ncbi:MAG: hypothetical protein KC589_10915, partial [Nanoarchaeota archaeon]|nr:hypothetical protein [Nanoarchaeota archaeon]
NENKNIEDLNRENSLNSQKSQIDDINSKIEYIRSKIYFLQDSNELESKNTIESILDNLERKILDEESKEGLKTEFSNLENIFKKILKLKTKCHLSLSINESFLIEKTLALLFILKLKINLKFIADSNLDNADDFILLLKFAFENLTQVLENYGQSAISAYNGIKENSLNTLIDDVSEDTYQYLDSDKLKSKFHSLETQTYKLISSYEETFLQELKDEIIKSSGDYDIENYPNLDFLISFRIDLENLSLEKFDFDFYEKKIKQIHYNLMKEVDPFSKNGLEFDFDYIKTILEDYIDILSNNKNNKENLDKKNQTTPLLIQYLIELTNYLKLLEIRLYLLFFKNAKDNLKDKYSFYYDNLSKFYRFYDELKINHIFEHDILNFKFISKKLKRIISPIKPDQKSPFWNSETWAENSKRINTKEHFEEILSYIQEMLDELKPVEKKQKIKI